MKRLIPALLLSCLFYACKKLTFENAEVKSLINGSAYFWKNKSRYGVNKYPQGTWASMTDTTLQVFLEGNTKTKKSKEYKIIITIPDFKGTGNYTSRVMVHCSMINYEIEEGATFTARYDSSPYVHIHIEEIDSAKGLPKVSGSFELELLKTESTRHDSLFPTTLYVTEGVFEEIKIKEEAYLGL